ncbi:C-type lectin domain family 2 member E-like isoform 2-T2 [Anomaloglossus baeobatrachus]
MGPTPEEATEAAMCVAEQLDSVKSSLTGDVEYKPKKCHVKRMTLLTALICVICVLLFIGLVVLALIKDKCQSPNSKITLPDSRDPCEDGWIWYMRKCYYFSTNISEWENSQDFCASKNASLAIIDRKYELDFILRFKGSSDHWIGLRRENESKPWVWTNGSIYDNNMIFCSGLWVQTITGSVLDAQMIIRPGSGLMGHYIMKTCSA